MTLSRRDVLRGAAVAAATVAACPAKAIAADRSRPAPPEGIGMLYDSTRCIGCKTCMVACKRTNNLPPEQPGQPHDDPVDLSATCKTIIKATRERSPSFLKMQCMHCLEPACVSVCMISALYKRDDGTVAYEPSRCIGCRYCQVACPFNVPKFEWEAVTPKIVKCELCRHRVAAGREPACTEVCPRDAVIFGKRDELLAEAKRRIAANPGRYVDRVYGEHEAGGTRVLMLSAVPFEKLGLANLPHEPGAKLTESIQHGLYQGLVAPLCIYAALAGVMWRHRRNGGTGRTS